MTRKIKFIVVFLQIILYSLRLMEIRRTCYTRYMCFVYISIFIVIYLNIKIKIKKSTVVVWN
jgi:hypothetical protein